MPQENVLIRLCDKSMRRSKGKPPSCWGIERLPVRRQWTRNVWQMNEQRTRVTGDKTCWIHRVSMGGACWLGFQLGGIVGDRGCWDVRVVRVCGELPTGLHAAAPCPSWNLATENPFSRHPPYLPRMCTFSLGNPGNGQEDESWFLSVKSRLCGHFPAIPSVNCPSSRRRAGPLS